MDQDKDDSPRFRELARCLAEVREEQMRDQGGVRAADANTITDDELRLSLQAAGLPHDQRDRDDLRDLLREALRDLEPERSKPGPAATHAHDHADHARVRLQRAAIQMQSALIQAAAVKLADMGRDATLREKSPCGCDPYAVLAAWTMNMLADAFLSIDDMMLNGVGVCDDEYGDCDCLNNGDD